jgi:hypothetical protein
MSEYTGAVAAAGEHEIYLLHTSEPHPDAFGVSTGHPMTPDPEPGSGQVNYHPGPDFAPREPEAGL